MSAIEKAKRGGNKKRNMSNRIAEKKRSPKDITACKKSVYYMFPFKSKLTSQQM